MNVEMLVDTITEGTTDMDEPKEPKTTSEPGLMTVSRIYTEGGAIVKEEADEELIEIKPFQTATGTVEFAIGMTLNLGNYESVKVHVGVSLPHYMEQQEAAFSAAKKFVDTKLNEEVDKIRSYRKSKEGA